MFLEHRSNVQENEENSNRSLINLFELETLIRKRQYHNSQASIVKSETETNFRILTIYFFFGIKNVRVGRSIRSTHIFFWPAALEYIAIKFDTYQGSTLTVVRLPGASENGAQLVRSCK